MIKALLMKKRVLSLMIALVLPIVLLCGCSSGERMSPEEYKSAIMSSYKKYITSFTDMAPYLPPEPFEANAENVSLIQSNSAKLEECLDKHEEAFNDFKEMNPPEEYEELHKKLIKAINTREKEQLAITRKLVKAKTPDDISDYNEEIEREAAELTPEASDFLTGTTFPAVYTQIIMKLIEDKVLTEDEILGE